MSKFNTPPETYTHEPEAPFEENLANWFTAQYCGEIVETQVYQSDPRWFCDIVVRLPSHTLYIECESRASEVRPGIAQALGYATDDLIAGIPMVVTPSEHIWPEKVERLRQSIHFPVRQFDAEAGEFVR